MGQLSVEIRSEVGQFLMKLNTRPQGKAFTSDFRFSGPPM